MNYAITVNQNGTVTGVHVCSVAFGPDHFANSAVFAGDDIIPIDGAWEGIEGLPLAALNEDYTAKPLPWLIEHGYRECPPGYDLIEGELVETDVPEGEAPPTLKAKLDEIAQQNEAEQKASRVMFRALAQTDVIKQTDALDNAGMFPLWDDCIGQRAESGSYWRHGGKLWRVNAGQGHTIQADWAPDKAVSLFSLAANPTDEWLDWIQPTGAHNAYGKGAKVTYNGKRWVSTADANVWAPGAYGWIVQ